MTQRLRIGDSEYKLFFLEGWHWKAMPRHWKGIKKIDGCSQGLGKNVPQSPQTNM